jgi:NAD(P)-dependent dehydrogenase (short-subunit alcohol dehydrogenase family)
MFSLGQKKIVITGAAGILGVKMSEEFLKNDCNLILIDSDKIALNNLIDRLNDINFGKTKGFAIDISDQNLINDLYIEIKSSYGSVDVLVNNAATKGDNLKDFFEKFEDYSLKTWNEVMGVNLSGAFLITQAFGRLMLEKKTGSIINISSIYGLLGVDNRIYEGSEYLGMEINTPAIYAASKAGLIGLTRYLASYWGKNGIRVNCICPGGIESGQNNEFVKKYSARIPMGRMARVEEIVNPVLFLASEASSYMNGQIIAVDGGLTCW